MPKTLGELLAMSRERQAEELRKLSRMELEVLFFELDRLRPPREKMEDIDRFYIAVFSMIRDRREPKRAGGGG